MQFLRLPMVLVLNIRRERRNGLFPKSSDQIRYHVSFRRLGSFAQDMITEKTARTSYRLAYTVAKESLLILDTDFKLLRRDRSNL